MSAQAKAWVWEQSSALRHSTLFVLLAIAEHADDDGYAAPTIATLKQYSRTSEATVRRSIATLVGLGELEVCEPNRYRMPMPQTDRHVPEAKYTRGWNKALRDSIRSRDGHACRICGEAPEGPNGLAVHHRDGSKSNHHPDNLITLCSPCHTRVHKSRNGVQLLPA